jgi:hypothetical protein
MRRRDDLRRTGATGPRRSDESGEDWLNGGVGELPRSSLSTMVVVGEAGEGWSEVAAERGGRRCSGESRGQRPPALDWGYQGDQWNEGRGMRSSEGARGP